MKQIWILILGLTCGAMQQAAGYEIDWWIWDGGGGTSTGQVYAVSGSFGQPIVGSSSTAGQTYAIMAGTWEVFGPGLSTEAPLLRIEQNGGRVIVSWPVVHEGYVLEEAGAIGRGVLWETVASRYELGKERVRVTLPATTGQRYFRLRLKEGD